MSLEKAQRYFVVRSPFAELLVCGVKKFEFRSNAKTFANKRLAVAVSKTRGTEKELRQEIGCWKSRLEKTLVAKSPEEREAAFVEFWNACEKAKGLFSKTNGSGMIVGEVKTGDAGILDGESGVRILECGLWAESEWVKSPGGLGVRYMPGVERPEAESASDFGFARKSPFARILDKYREESFSERDKGNRFELLMQRYLKTDPVFANTLSEVWLWNDFFAKDEFGGKDDSGIGLGKHRFSFVR